MRDVRPLLLFPLALAMLPGRTHAETRSGMSFSAAVGPGLLVQNTCVESQCESRTRLRASLSNLSASYHLGDRVALTAFTSGGVHGDDGARSHDLFAFGAQWWAAEMLWLRAGVGIGVESSPGRSSDGPTHVGLGAAATLGLDLLRRGDFVLDVRLRGTSTTLDLGDDATRNSTSFDGLVGLTWHALPDL